MFDPDGDQAAADSTRSSTSLDTGSSLNPRTARRLVTASYTSIIASYRWPSVAHPHPASGSVRPVGRYKTKGVAGDRHPADGRERQVSGHHRLAGRRQFPQETDPDADRLLGIVVESVVPVGAVEV